MKRVSEKRQAENMQRWDAMAVVGKRDDYACVGAQINPKTGRQYLPGPCAGALHGHEIITRADGGSITDPGNIVLLCDGHNGWCDLNYEEAKRRGFRQPRKIPFTPTVADRLPHMGVV